MQGHPWPVGFTLNPITQVQPMLIGGADVAGVVRMMSLGADGAPAIGNSLKPTYEQSEMNAALTGANDAVFDLHAGASKITRLRRLTIFNVGAQTAAGRIVFELLRTTAAATGGTARTPTPVEAADGAFSGIFTGNKPTLTPGTSILQFSFFVPAALAAFIPYTLDFTNGQTKGLVIPAGVANGIALRSITGAAGAANFDCAAEFTEESA